MNHRLIKYFYFFIIAIVLNSGCSEERVKPSLVSIPEKDLPDNEIWNSKIVFSDSGIVKAILEAGLIRVYNSRNTTYLDKSVRIDFYDKKMNHLSTLTADRGKVDHLTNDLYAYDNVIARSDSGVVLTTSELKWDEAKKKITTDKYIEINSPKENIRGYGLESDPSLSDYVIYRVSGNIEAKENITK